MAGMSCRIGFIDNISPWYLEHQYYNVMVSVLREILLLPHII